MVYLFSNPFGVLTHLNIDFDSACTTLLRVFFPFSLRSPSSPWPAVKVDAQMNNKLFLAQSPAHTNRSIESARTLVWPTPSHICICMLCEHFRPERACVHSCVMCVSSELLVEHCTASCSVCVIALHLNQAWKKMFRFKNTNTIRDGFFIGENSLQNSHNI